MRWISLVVFGLGIAAGNPAAARGCFCLIDGNGKVNYDCVEFPNASTGATEVDCRLHPGTGRQPILDWSTKHRLAVGEPPCDPCEVAIVPENSWHGPGRGDDPPAGAPNQGPKP